MAEAVDHLCCLVTDLDQGRYVLKNAVRDSRNGQDKAMLELSLLARAGTQRLSASVMALTPWRELRLRRQDSARLVWQRRGGVAVASHWKRLSCVPTCVQLGDPTSRHRLQDVPGTMASSAEEIDTDMFDSRWLPLKRFNRMKSGYWVLETDKEVRVWCIVRELAMPQRHAVDVPRLTRGALGQLEVPLVARSRWDGKLRALWRSWRPCCGRSCWSARWITLW